MKTLCLICRNCLCSCKNIVIISWSAAEVCFDPFLAGESFLWAQLMGMSNQFTTKHKPTAVKVTSTLPRAHQSNLSNCVGGI